MATANYSITSLGDIPALVHAFADTAGWTVTGTTSAPVLTHPTLAGAVSFTLTKTTETIPGYDSGWNTDYLRWSDGTHNAEIWSPWSGATYYPPTVVAPSRVYLFGALTPEPYLAITVEYGYNRYRHLYFGYAEKIGSYNGGEIIYGSNFIEYYGRSISYRRSDCSYPFSSLPNLRGSRPGGWMKIDHADNPTTWRKFRREDPSIPVMGGYGDDINEIMVARGLSPYAGSTILVPCNLYCRTSVGNYVPVGRPAGVRLVNMRDTEPAASINDGIYDWTCFPVFRKNLETTPSVTTDQWSPDETSANLGMAYLEG